VVTGLAIPLVGDALRVPPPNRKAERFPYNSCEGAGWFHSFAESCGRGCERVRVGEPLGYAWTAASVPSSQ
jgi:hypothetical protein